MARSIWKGSISFGLVNIPVTLYPAEDRQETIHFTMLDERDMTPVGYERVSKSSGEPVPWDNIVKGYEYDDGQYVVITPDDLAKANPKATQTVEIMEFVDLADVDPALFEKPYLLEPGKRGEKGYALLREALARSGKVGISKVVIRTRQYLAAVMPRGPALVLETMRFPHELRDPKKLDLPAEDMKEAGVSKKELEMAEKLVASMSGAWDPKQYRDDYTEDVLAMIERKVKTGEVESVEEPDEVAKPSKVVDLMPLLQASLERKAGAKKGKAADKGAGTKRRPTRAEPKGGRTTRRKTA